MPVQATGSSALNVREHEQTSVKSIAAKRRSRPAARRSMSGLNKHAGKNGDSSASHSRPNSALSAVFHTLDKPPDTRYRVYEQRLIEHNSAYYERHSNLRS